MLRSAFWFLAACLGACSSRSQPSAPPTSEVRVPPTREVTVRPADPTRGDRPASPASGLRASESADDLPPAWASCQADTDCTFVSLGCCDTTPVNRGHRIDAQRSLDASGHPWCAPKSACGPGLDGTWAGMPGVCRDARCRMP